jgi:hypothetical protein
MKLVVCHPVALENVRKFDGKWIYADNDIDELERVRMVLLNNRAEPLCLPQKFQSYVAESRDEITAWMDANLVGLPVNSILLTPLSRNPFSSLLLAHLVWIRIIAAALAAEKYDLLLVTRSAAFANTIGNHAATLGISHERVGKPHFLLSTVRQRGQSALKWGIELVQSVCRVVLSRLMLGAGHMAKIRSVDVLVGTYLFSDDVSSDGTVKHRYFPGLVDWYRNRGLTPAYYPFLSRVPPWHLPVLYRGYRKSSYIFVPPERLYSIADIAYSTFQIGMNALRGFPLRQPCLFGVDVSILVADRAVDSALEGLPQLLMAATPKRMVGSGIRPRWSLRWFENQSIDQAMERGLRDVLPECRTIALRLYAQYSSNLLSFQVTERERKEGLVPEEHWLGGAAWLKTATTYDPGGKYKIVPSLRYAYLHRQQSETMEGTGLLVLLTHSMNESAQVLANIELVLPTLHELFPVIRIKPHPTLSMQDLKRATRDRYSALWASKVVRWETDGIASLLTSARLAISAGTSSAIEAVSMGVPVLIIGAQVGIDMCPLEFIDERLWRIVFDANQLERVIREWTPHPIPRKDRVAIGTIIMKECFEPATEEGMERFALG